MSATELQVLTLTQMTSGEEWRLGLAHDKPYHALFWFTPGRGRILLEGRRRGLGPHNAVFIPAGSLFSVDLGRQSLGQVVTIPVGTPLRLPDMPRHLRVLDGQVQSELSAIINWRTARAVGDTPPLSGRSGSPFRADVCLAAPSDRAGRTCSRQTQRGRAAFTGFRAADFATLYLRRVHGILRQGIGRHADPSYPRGKTGNG